MIKPVPSLSKQAIGILAATVGSQLLYVAVTVAVASRAGPTSFGHAAAVLGVAGFLVGIVDLGSSGFAVRELAAGRMQAPEYWARARGKVLAALALSLAAAVVVSLTQTPVAGLGVGVFTAARVAWMSVGVPLRADRRGGRWAVSILADRVSAAVCLILLLSLRVSAINAFWVSISLGTISAVALGALLTPGASRMFALKRVSNPWRGCSGYAAASTAVSLSFLDTTLLGVTAGPTQAGVYAAVSRWTQPILVLSDVFSQAAAPFIAAARDHRSAFHSIRRSLWIPACGLLAAVLVFVLAPYFVSLVLGDRFAESAPVLRILAIGALVVLLNQPLATFLQSRGYDRLVGAAMITMALTELFAIWVLGGVYGALGGALAYLGAQVLLLLLLAAPTLVLRHTAGASARSSKALDQ